MGATIQNFVFQNWSYCSHGVREFENYFISYLVYSMQVVGYAKNNFARIVVLVKALIFATVL